MSGQLGRFQFKIACSAYQIYSLQFPPSSSVTQEVFAMAVEETVLGSGAYGRVVKIKLHDDVVARKIIHSDYFDSTNDSSQLKKELFEQEYSR